MTVCINHRFARSRRLGFSLTELLVVIGIIALLVGLLLVALAQVRDRGNEAETQVLMQAFAQACQTYQMEHGNYPGVIPENILARQNEAPADNGGNPEYLTSTENALLALCGGYRLRTPLDVDGSRAAQEYLDFAGAAGDRIVTFEWTIGSQRWFLAIDPGKVGEGPIINGKRFEPYFSVDDHVRPTQGQEGDPILSKTGESLVSRAVPDLLDAWGQPILYVRRRNSVNELALPNISQNSQFTLVGLEPYLDSDKLGELKQPQPYDGSAVGSLLALDTIDDRYRIFAQSLRNKGIGAADDTTYGTPRGEFALYSAGADGIFFSSADGRGRPDSMIGGSGGITIDEFIDLGPGEFDEFDDIRVFGGG